MWLPQYATPGERIGRTFVVLFAVLVALFLVAPLLVVVPLSFADQPFFTFPVPSYSVRWYADFFSSERWIVSVFNSLVVAVLTAVIATVLGTLAALGLSRPDFPGRGFVMAVLISPMIVPIVIVAVGAYLFFGNLGLANTRTGLVLSHTALALPFVIVTVTATLSGYDRNLSRAAASLGAPPLDVFRRVTLPLIAPGVASGAVFAFATSFDEVVVALFLTGAEQRTLPVQMFSGIRDQINPTIMAAATMLIALSVALFVTVGWLARRAKG
ncbi:ABC transporter permease [Chthonobacter albigriseus]|uniref:ABC transporter permease n=1 Tax=Chthonobacter albigriseus TaxID=1683161 RepID=UPI0015EE4267|nr:ABC transporter permease [Chthonobacter albigriseus]